MSSAIANRVKDPAIKPDDLSSITEIYMVEGENELPQSPLSYIPELWCMCSQRIFYYYFNFLFYLIFRKL